MNNDNDNKNNTHNAALMVMENGNIDTAVGGAFVEEIEDPATVRIKKTNIALLTVSTVLCLATQFKIDNEQNPETLHMTYLSYGISMFTLMIGAAARFKKLTSLIPFVSNCTNLSMLFIAPGAAWIPNLVFTGTVTLVNLNHCHS